FAAGKYGAPTATGADVTSTVKGLFYGGGLETLWTQTYGTWLVAASVLVVSLALMYAVKATGTLRVSAAGEREGLDLHEHGVDAYPEFVMTRGAAGLIAHITARGPEGEAAP